MQEVNIRYTKLRDGNWIIESNSQVPITALQNAMKFVDDEGNTHEIVRATTPNGYPEAPYYYFVEVTVRS